MQLLKPAASTLTSVHAEILMKTQKEMQTDKHFGIQKYWQWWVTSWEIFLPGNYGQVSVWVKTERADKRKTASPFPHCQFLAGATSFLKQPKLFHHPKPAIRKASSLSAFAVTRSRDGRNKPLSALSWHRVEGTKRDGCYPCSIMLQLCPEGTYRYLHLS